MIARFEEQQDEYLNTWQNRDESDNFKQEYDKKMLESDVMPMLEDKLRKEVDEMIECELENIRLLASSGKKTKAKKGKKMKGKKKKKGKKKGLKLPGYKQIKDLKPPELLVQLITVNVVKKLPP